MLIKAFGAAYFLHYTKRLFLRHFTWSKFVRHQFSIKSWTFANISFMNCWVSNIWYHTMSFSLNIFLFQFQRTGKRFGENGDGFFRSLWALCVKRFRGMGKVRRKVSFGCSLLLCYTRGREILRPKIVICKKALIGLQSGCIKYALNVSIE